MRSILIAAAALMATCPAWAVFKVVGPDGRVTYTDRPPNVEAASRVATLQPGSSPEVAPGLPYELRQVTQKFPVTLYTSADCVPCDSARQLLQQRGVPYAEKRIGTEADAQALDQLGAGRMLPGLSIGPRQLRGLSTGEWTSYLDAAGYPRESRLPRDWQPPAVTALAEPRAAPPAQEAERQKPIAPPARRRATVPASPDQTASTLRF